MSWLSDNLAPKLWIDGVEQSPQRRALELIAGSGTTIDAVDADERTKVTITSPGGGGGEHAASHIKDGSDEVDGDQVDIDVALPNIVPDTSPGEVSDNAHLGAILRGISNILGTLVTGQRTVKAKVAALTNIASLTGTSATPDGTAISNGDVVLATAQDDQTENGPWVVGSPWTRPAWFADGSNAGGTFCIVQQGATKADSRWLCTSDDPSAVVGTNNLVFSEIANPSTPDLEAVLGAGNDANGTTITGLPAPSAANDATRKVYVDDADALRLTGGTWAADNRVLRSDGTGRAVQVGAATEDDSGNVTGWTSVTSQRHRVTSKSEHFESGAGSNEKLWDETATGDVLTARTRTDADGAGATWREVERQGTAVSRIRHTSQYGQAETVDSFSVEVDTASAPAASSILRDKAGAAVALTAGFTYTFCIEVEIHDASIYEEGEYHVVAHRPSAGNVAIVAVRSAGDATTSGLDMQFAADTGTQTITCEPISSGEGVGDRKVRWSSRLIRRKAICTVDT